MRVLYVDEYGEDLFAYESDIIPTSGDTVSIEDEDWRVRSRTFIPELSTIVVELTQNLIKSKASNEDDGRLKEMQHAILDITKRQNLQEKRTKSLREQAMSIRQQIRRNTPKSKETT